MNLKIAFLIVIFRHRMIHPEEDKKTLKFIFFAKNYGGRTQIEEWLESKSKALANKLSKN